MPLSVFLGRPLSERHDHYDAGGVFTGHTIVTRDPAWDEESRQAAWDEWQMQMESCAQCGGPRSECESPDGDWYPHTQRCWKKAAAEVAERQWAAAHEQEKPGQDGYKDSDGAFVTVLPYDSTPGAQWPSGEPVVTEP